MPLLYSSAGTGLDPDQDMGLKSTLDPGFLWRPSKLSRDTFKEGTALKGKGDSLFWFSVPLWTSWKCSMIACALICYHGTFHMCESQDFMNLVHKRTERNKDRDWREMAEINGDPGGVGDQPEALLNTHGHLTYSWYTGWLGQTDTECYVCVKIMRLK